MKNSQQPKRSRKRATRSKPNARRRALRFRPIEAAKAIASVASLEEFAVACMLVLRTDNRTGVVRRTTYLDLQLLLKAGRNRVQRAVRGLVEAGILLPQRGLVAVQYVWAEEIFAACAKKQTASKNIHEALKLLEDFGAAQVLAAPRAARTGAEESPPPDSGVHVAAERALAVSHELESFRGAVLEGYARGYEARYRVRTTGQASDAVNAMLHALARRIGADTGESVIRVGALLAEAYLGCESKFLLAAHHPLAAIKKDLHQIEGYVRGKIQRDQRRVMRRARTPDPESMSTTMPPDTLLLSDEEYAQLTSRGAA